jgi:hypothetical protein
LSVRFVRSTPTRQTLAAAAAGAAGAAAIFNMLPGKLYVLRVTVESVVRVGADPDLSWERVYPTGYPFEVIADGRQLHVASAVVGAAGYAFLHEEATNAPL